MAFLFEKLEVYRRALALYENVEEISKRIKGMVPYVLIDQLTRAALSVPLNLAEGHGRKHPKERQHFIWIARGSLFEMVPIIRLIQRRNLVMENETEKFLMELEELSKMATGLAQSVQ